jgi:uncharacterized protein YciI
VAQTGKVVVYGPVKDGTGAWGLGVFEAGSEAEVREIAEADPAISSGMMPVTILRR